MAGKQLESNVLKSIHFPSTKLILVSLNASNHHAIPITENLLYSNFVPWNQGTEVWIWGLRRTKTGTTATKRWNGAHSKTTELLQWNTTNRCASASFSYSWPSVFGLLAACWVGWLVVAWLVAWLVRRVRNEKGARRFCACVLTFVWFAEG